VGISEGDVKDLHENYRVIPVKLEQTRLTVEVNVDVIHVPQHPEGREKGLSYSKVCGINESEVFYTAGAYCGSSGSPVLYCKNSIMYVLALHKDGEVKLSDGSPARRGILMSAILDDMCGKSC
jgi:V8-like Glu-specific endopeptidase